MFINYAHRGASSYAPENTLVAFKKAIELGANGIELDLQETKDGKIVIFHDSIIDNKSNGLGQISDYTYQELIELDFGSWFDKKYKNEKIMLFENFAKEFLSMDMTFAIELKVENIEQKVLDIINKYKKKDNFYISSFNYNILKNMRNKDKNIKLSWLVEKIDKTSIDKAKLINLSQICPRAETVNCDDIILANRNGLGVRLWGVKTEEIMKKTYKFNIEGMTVNFPDKLKKLLDNNC